MCISIFIVCMVSNTCIGSLIGFVNMGDVNTHLQDFEKSPSGEQTNRGTLASTMLVFMVRGLFSRLEYPYVQFPCHTLSSDKMFDPFWEAVSRLERLGLKVMGLTSFRQGKGLQSSQPLCGGESQSVFLF